MAEKISMPALEGLILHFMAGGLSQCPDWWGEENISVCYNKLYYIVDGECYIKINQQEFIAHPGQIFFLPSGSKQTYYNISNNHVQNTGFIFPPWTAIEMSFGIYLCPVALTFPFRIKKK